MQNTARYEYEGPYNDFQPSFRKAADPDGKKDLLFKVLTIGMIVFIMGIIFCIVWEAAEARSLEVQRDNLKVAIAELDEQKRELNAQVARFQMPEELVRMAMEGDIRFVAIDPKSAVRIGGDD